MIKGKKPLRRQGSVWFGGNNGVTDGRCFESSQEAGMMGLVGRADK